MFLQDEQNIIKWLSQYGALPKLQISKLLQVPEVAEEKILKNLQRHRKITDVGGGYYWGLDRLCKPEQRTELAIWILLQFIDQVDPRAHYPATYPAQVYFLKENIGYLYYINANLKAVKNGKYWVTKTNGIVKSGLQRDFDAQGRMIAKNGILPLNGNGALVYYVNDDVQSDLGLVRMADGRMIYVNSDATLKANGTYYLTKTNGLLPQGYYSFDSNCILQFNGWFTYDQGTTYYQNGIMHGTGWEKIGDSFYYFNNNGFIVTGVQRVPYPAEELLPGYGPDAEDAEVNVPGKEGNPDNYDYPDNDSALFVFDENGVFQKEQCSLYDDNGVTRWIGNGMVIWHAGLVKDGDDYRYFKRNGMVANIETYVAKTNGLLEAAKYTFTQDFLMRKFILPNVSVIDNIIQSLTIARFMF